MPDFHLPDDDKVRAAGRRFAETNAALGDIQFAEELRHVRRQVMSDAHRNAPLDDDGEFLRAMRDAFNHLHRAALQHRRAQKRLKYQAIAMLFSGNPAPASTILEEP